MSKTITKDELKKILEDHAIWLSGEGGERADLRGADLSYADLRGADLSYAYLRDANLRDTDLSYTNLSCADLRGAQLWNCAGNRREIKSIFVYKSYPISYTATNLQIGCENHTISEWWDFDHKRILAMDGDKALEFWRENKDFIKMTIEKYPAVKTGDES